MRENVKICDFASLEMVVPIHDKEKSSHHFSKRALPVTVRWVAIECVCRTARSAKLEKENPKSSTQTASRSLPHRAASGSRSSLLCLEKMAALTAVPACAGAARRVPSASRAQSAAPCAGRPAVTLAAGSRTAFLSGTSGDAKRAAFAGTAVSARATARTNRLAVRTSANAATANAPAAPAVR